MSIQKRLQKIKDLIKNEYVLIDLSAMSMTDIAQQHG
jgi:hypothetical protein